MSVEKIRFYCQWCDAELVVPRSRRGRRVSCGSCERVLLVPGGSSEDLDTVLGFSKEMPKAGLNFYQRYVSMPVPSPMPSLRRCPVCRVDAFRSVKKCDAGHWTVGLDTAKVAMGIDMDEQVAVSLFESLKKIVYRVHLIMATVIIATILYFLLFENWLAIIFSLSWKLLVLGLIWIGLLMLCRSYAGQYIEKRFPGRRRAKGKSVLYSKVSRTIIEPFLSRNGVRERGFVSLPDSEWPLIGAVLKERGIEVTDEVLPLVLSSFALSLDFDQFAKRLACLVDEEAGGTGLEVYALLEPEGHRDDRDRPYLQQMQAILGKESGSNVINKTLQACRQRHKVEDFKKDLESRRSEMGGFDITVEQVDIMDPYNFELLIGMIYKSEGYTVEETRKTGDQGADVIVQRGGEKTVIQTKLYSKPVSNSAVQQVVAAKRYWSCHKMAVVTNNTYTKSAKELASANEVALIDRPLLKKWIGRFNSKAKNYAKLALVMRPRTESFKASRLSESEEPLASGADSRGSSNEV